MSDENKWKNFELSVDLHKFYVEFSVKLNLFHYAITGGVVSFHFSKESPPESVLGLLLPIVLSILLGFFYLYSSGLASKLALNIKHRANDLDLEAYPDGNVLTLLCLIFGLTSLVMGISLLLYTLGCLK